MNMLGRQSIALLALDQDLTNFCDRFITQTNSSNIFQADRQPSQEQIYYTIAAVRLIPSLDEPFGAEALSILDYVFL